MKKNIVIFLLFVVAATVFLVAVTFSNNTRQPDGNSTNINNTPAVECFKNTDCSIAGCSGQLCVPRDQAPGIVTTCEWRDEYACYDQVSCVCRNNQCQWQQGEAYQKCLEELQ